MLPVEKSSDGWFVVHRPSVRGTNPGWLAKVRREPGDGCDGARVRQTMQAHMQTHERSARQRIRAHAGVTWVAAGDMRMRVGGGLFTCPPVGRLSRTMRFATLARFGVT